MKLLHARVYACPICTELYRVPCQLGCETCRAKMDGLRQELKERKRISHLANKKAKQDNKTQ